LPLQCGSWPLIIIWHPVFFLEKCNFAPRLAVIVVHVKSHANPLQQIVSLACVLQKEAAEEIKRDPSKANDPAVIRALTLGIP
jgi:hypothetical protein